MSWWERWCLVDRPGDADRAAVFRVLFFAVLAADCWENLAHLGRYGAGRFNVSHLAWADGLIPAPEKEWMVALVLLQVFLALRAAFGVALRQTLPLLALAYSVTYFWSQLDSYQHHYLISVLLWLLALAVLLEGDDRLPGWALRGVGAVLSIVYFWAAVAKMDPQWLNGLTLSTQIKSEWGRETFEGRYAELAGLVVSVEFALALGWQLRRLALPTLLLGCAMHIGIEVLGFRIGLFSYFMFASYSLLLPAAWHGALVRRVRDIFRLPGPCVPWQLGIGAVVLFAGWALLPFGGAALVAAIAIAALSGWGLSSRRQVVLQISTVALLWSAHASTDVARDYYRYIGGDTRRRGQVDEAIAAYGQVTRLDPSYFSGHVRLGDFYGQRGEWTLALDEYELAHAIEPANDDLPERLERARSNAGSSR